MAVVVERLLHEESKVNERSEDSKSNAMTSRHRRKASVKCYHCNKFGHIRRNCPEIRANSTQTDKRSDSFGQTVKRGTTPRQKVNQLCAIPTEDCSSEDEVISLMVRHVLSASDMNNPSRGDWIVDSGATCHICNDLRQFASVNNLSKPMEVIVGDGRALKASKSGVVELKLLKPNGQKKLLHITDALFVPELSYSLLSVPKATQNGATITFNGTSCQILDESKRVITEATQRGKLYYLKTVVNTAVQPCTEYSKETLWHRRYAHLSSRNLQKLSREGLVTGLDFDYSKESEFCESCADGKHHRSSFPKSSNRRAKQPLELIHSDVCGRLSEHSLGGAQ